MILSHPDAVAILRKSELFASQSMDILDPFAEQARFHEMPKGTIIFSHEQSAEHFYIIVSGWVKLSRETLDGNEAVIDVLHSGHMFGELALFENMQYVCNAEVAEDAELLFLPLHLLDTMIASHHDFARQLLHVMSSTRVKRDKELEHRDMQSAAQRIGCFLLRLCGADAESPLQLYLPYDKTLIASRLGMKPETFSRGLATLRKHVDLTIQGAALEIKDVEQLTAYTCNACSFTYPCEDL